MSMKPKILMTINYMIFSIDTEKASDEINIFMIKLSKIAYLINFTCQIITKHTHIYTLE